MSSVPTGPGPTSAPPASPASTSSPPSTTSSLSTSSISTSTTSTSSTSSSSTTSSTTSVPTTTTQPSTTSTSAPSAPTTTSTTAQTVPSVSTATSASTTQRTTIFITSTASQSSQTQSDTSGLTSSTSAATAPATTTAAASSHGLSAAGTIAVAVVVPVASVALIICVLLWWWRKHKANKLAEEERRKEVEEYGFNPNNDPALPGVAAGGVASSYGDPYEPKDSSSGYRGWGTTSHPRKPSTNLSSGAGVGIPLSDTGSAPVYHHATSPSDGTTQHPDGPGRPDSGDVADVVGGLGAHDGDIHRGPSNASSAYSHNARSDGSDDGHIAPPGNQYYDDGNPYYNDIHHQPGPYGDPGYGGAPVIRDVQARRNTRIENAGVYPQQGNAGIAQNF